MKNVIFFSLLVLIVFGCTKTVQIGENTFVHNRNVYRVIDNEVTKLGSLRSDSISQSIVLNQELKDYGFRSLNYIREDASSNLSAVYRGDVLYFKFELFGLNDLRKKYTGGGVSINFLDKYGFEIHSTTIEMSELTRILGSDNETLNYEYNGKTKMSSEVYRAIKEYSVSYSLRTKNQFNW